MIAKLDNDFFIQKEQLLANSEIRSSKEKLAELISDEFIEIMGNGEYCNKEDVLLGILSDTASGYTYTSSNFKEARLASDIGVVIYQTESQNDKKEVAHYQRSSLWKNEEGIWRNIFHQATKIEKDLA